MLRIIGRKTSSNVMKVLWACAELGLDFEREDLGGPFGGNDSPEYQALNPNGRVPTIVEDDFVLWESNSIIRYLAHEHGNGTLWPTDARTRARGERWMDWQLSVMSPVMVPVFWGLVRTPEAERDMDAIAKARDQLTGAMAILDRYLGETEFVAGPEFSVGDIPVGIGTYRWFALQIEREDYPNLKRWYDALTERAGYREHIMNPME
jgi:glutathione S-transferase